ncbi:tetratricopeptide repeat protein [Methylocystis sp. 9N]|uniref:Tetratricopeptide repeat protein n=1 Tax=Methylocystis borbori TaxID=3118750 RepID=A0ABU7XGK7_9HYPH
MFVKDAFPSVFGTLWDRRPATRVLAALLCACAMTAARAGEYEDAAAAARRGDFAAAFKQLKPLADKGDARAQADLGVMYFAGKGVAADPKEALKWTRRAAEQGSPSAQFNLGSIYLEGQIVLRDAKEAMKWNLLAAGQGLAAAQVNIASMYYDGDGVAQDYKEAVRWLRLAAEQGDPEAQLNLGNMYVAGQGVERDLLRGYMWTRIASDSLSMSDADKKSLRDLSAKTLSPEELAKGQAMAAKCQESKFKNCD